MGDDEVEALWTEVLTSGDWQTLSTDDEQPLPKGIQPSITVTKLDPTQQKSASAAGKKRHAPDPPLKGTGEVPDSLIRETPVQRRLSDLIPTDVPAMKARYEDQMGTPMPFNCPHCSYSGVRKDLLKLHVLTHTGENPFFCPYCSYQAPFIEMLEEHVHVHTGEHPYCCPYCSFSSPERKHLENHLSVHVKEKPFACSECPFRATQKSVLDIHLQTHDDKDISD